MIRNYEHGDHEEIAKIFPQAIHQIASEYYTEEQCLAWSEKEPNPLHWEKRCAKKKPFVYLIKGAVVGFIELDPDGHIDCLYVHPLSFNMYWVYVMNKELKPSMWRPLSVPDLSLKRSVLK